MVDMPESQPTRPRETRYTPEPAQHPVRFSARPRAE